MRGRPATAVECLEDRLLLAATATKLVFATTPTTGTAGTTLGSVKVDIESSTGAIVTTNTSTVTIAVASGPGGFTTASTTSVAAVSGVATFSKLALDTAGTYTFQVTDGSLTGATSGNITVSPAAASKLAFQQTPTTGTAGQALSPSITASVEDAFGNVVTTNTSTVTIAVASGPGALASGSTTTAKAASGVATFSNLILDTAGTYTFKVTDGSLTSATSGNIAVSAAAASKVVLEQTPTSGTAGQALSPSVTAAVEDAFGNVVTSNTSTETIALASGPGGFTSGSTTSVAAASGVATFNNLVLDTSGSYTLKVTDGSLTSATTGTISVSPGAANKLVVQTTTATGTAGQALGTLTVAVTDAYGNVLTSNTSTVTIAVASGPGGLASGSTTTAAAASGVATFSKLILDTAGTYTFKVTDGSLTSATSGSVIVGATTASKVVFQQTPTTGTAGQALSPSITAAVEDTYGNVVTSNTSTVTIAVASGPGGLTSGSTTTATAASGVATFSNLILDTSGTYTFKVTDGSLTSATSGNIVVGAGTASKVVLEQTPTSGTAGQALSPSITAAVEDAFGNVVTSNTSTETIAVASGPGGLTSGSTTSVAASSGVATFSNLVLDTSGSYTLAVSDSGLSGATTGTISVSPAGVSKLVLQQTPTTGTAGQALGALTVAVTDAYGNVLTSNTSTVTIAVASGPGGLTSGSTITAAAASGVATFSNLVLDTSGSYTFTVTDSGLTGATTGTVSVSPGAASKVVLQQTPSSGTAGQALSPSVTAAVEDAFGNVVTSNTSTVTIAVASGPGGLTSGSTTSVAAASGVATFSNLVLDTSGSYTLAVSDSGLTGATTGTISVSPGAASKVVLQQTPTSGTAGQALSPSVTAAVEDAFGNVVTSNTSTETIAVASGPGGLASGSTTTAAATSGVATFSNVVLDTSGSYTLKVTDGSLTSATSGTIGVSPATASKLVLQQTPTSGTAGQALGTLTVAVTDAYGNVLTGNTSTVTIAVASGPGGLTSGSTTSAVAASGVATFSNLVLDTSGSYTFTVTDSGLTNATTGTISVSPAAASKLVLQQTPTSGTAGQALSPSITVAVEDAFGNVVTSNTSTVTISVASGPGGLAASSTTGVAAVNGVATFSNLVLDTPGSDTLSVSDSGLTGATTGTINVSPGAASKLVLEQTPTSGTAGQALSPSVTVAVEDAVGNVLTGNTSTVTIAVASGPGGWTTGSTTSATVMNGVATFSNLVLHTSGSYTLTVSDSGLTGATTGSISVSPGAASQLAFKQTPTSGTAGTALSPSVTVAVEDAFGNVVTSNTSTVSMGIASGPGGIASGSNASAAAVNGIATFGDLVLSTSGSYTLAAVDTGLTGATSGAISISPGTANSDPPSGNSDVVSNDSSLVTASVALQQGTNNYSGMTNSWINGATGQTTTNYSENPTLYVDGAAGSEMDTLLRWDLTALSPSETIQSASITLNVEGLAGTPGPVNLYALDQPWNADTVTFEQASSGLPWEVPAPTVPPMQAQRSWALSIRPPRGRRASP